MMGRIREHGIPTHREAWIHCEEETSVGKLLPAANCLLLP
jgi:hypothetical protein